MLSTAHHHFSPMFSPLPSDMQSYSQTHQNGQRIQTSGLETLSNGSPYGLQHLHSMGIPGGREMGPATKSSTRNRHHPYENANPKSRDGKHKSDMHGKSTSGPVRRRISRACDQCNQLRTKCDGMNPCAHCVEFSLTCEYFRERKKRGKASRKDIAAQQQAAAQAVVAGSSNGNPDSPGYSSEHTSPTVSSGNGQESLKGQRSDISAPPPRTMSASGHSQQDSTSQDLNRSNSIDMGSHMGQRQHGQGMMEGQDPSPGPMGNFGVMAEYSRHPLMGMPINGQTDMNGQTMQMPQGMGSPGSYGFADHQYQMMGQEPQSSTFSFGRPGESPLGNFMASPVDASPGWLSLPSPSGGNFPSRQLLNPPSALKYPVLQPLLPKLTSIIPTSLACDLLDLYFSSSSSAHVHPGSPYLLGFIFRKRSFLHPSNPRRCSPALLASMLWVAAQSSEAPFLTSPPAARGKICQKLLELTVSLLKPLIHGAGSDGPANLGMNAVINGVALGGLGVANNDDQMTAEGGASGNLDDVATYFHLATVVSASEHKAASLRWWNVAWSLARELKLGRELPPNPPSDREQGEDEDAHGEVDLEMDEGGNNANNPMGSNPGSYTEEEREERRRVWWLLYTIDRHLALCYNRPLFLLDIECADLFQPINDDVWQAGEFYTGSSSLFPNPNDIKPSRHRGPNFECTSHSIFGYFTPLMTILGEIVDLNHARAHPKFGLTFRSAAEWDDQTAEITRQLEVYEQSLKDFEARCTAQWQADQQEPEHSMGGGEAGTPSIPSVRSVKSNQSRVTENIIHTKTVLAYGTHVMHVLHILLTGKWDPISLLDDSDLWISSQSFIFATQHAVSAAEAVSEILEYDPDLSFMPFFFGIYLLQGSFLLLLIADKLQGEASQSVVGACEVIVRAVEACVVTLNTEYQRNFRKVMRSALSQVKGRVAEDFGEQQQRRREVLSLYRWTGDGSGLAL